jgi:hypothetical protein
MLTIFIPNLIFSRRRVTYPLAIPESPWQIYEDIDLSEWIDGNPSDVLATNFGRPASQFEQFPHRDVFISAKHGT